MEAQPGGAALEAAARQARAFMRHYGIHDRFREDFEQEARAAVVAEWPVLMERYPDGFGFGMLQIVVNRRLVDALRREIGRPGREKAHATAVSIEDVYVQPTDDSDTEVDALLAVTADDMIEELIAPYVGAERDRLRLICRRIAEGVSQREIADELHVHESRISQILRALRSTAQQSDE